MATPAASVQTVHLDILTNYVVSMARTVELAVDRALSALILAGSPESRQAPGEIFLLEPRESHDQEGPGSPDLQKRGVG
jgi:hypothetical protein